MTCHRAEGRQGLRTQQDPWSQETFAAATETRSCTSEKVRVTPVATPNFIQGKAERHVTFATPVSVYSEDMMEARNQQRAPAPAQIMQYMSVMYNSKNT